MFHHHGHAQLTNTTILQRSQFGYQQMLSRKTRNSKPEAAIWKICEDHRSRKGQCFFKKTHTLYNTIFSKACFFPADLVISLTFIQLYNCLSPITTQIVLSQFYYLSIVTPFYLFKSVFQNRSAQISVQILMSPHTHSISDAAATFPA